MNTAELIKHEPQSIEHGPQTPMGLLQIALNNNAAIDVIERLAALQEKFMARDAEMQFNEAMNRVQSELGRIAPDLNNPQTHSKYASYAALDRVIRPRYSREGFSLSFDTGDSPREDTVRVLCYVSHRAGHTRKYQVDMPSDGKGAKGGDVMTKTHATGAAMSYGMRYLLKCIFNVAVGEDDTDGNMPSNGKLEDALKAINTADAKEKLLDIYRKAYNEFEANPAAVKVIVSAKNKKKEELSKCPA